LAEARGRLNFPRKVDTNEPTMARQKVSRMARNNRIRRTFTPQFKKDAVALLKEGRSASDVARSLGIARSLLQRWKDQLDRKRLPEVFPAPGHPTSEAQEIAELRKKLRRVTEERDILKKALAFFAEDES
jgi:transposase